jgi:O-antigen/teichoic acid export membrane protein
MAGITLSGTLLTQVDKLILIRMLPLEKFGYYALAGVVATVPGIIAFPVNNAVYPRFTQLVATRNFTELTELYHRSCQILSVLLIPTGLTLAFFSKEVMLVWTGSAVTAQNTFLLVTLLVTGFTLMGLMMVPYALQLAFAWTKLGLYLNIVAVITLIPSMIWLVSRYGVLGACFVWIALYTGQIIVMIHFMHRRIIQEEKWKWYINDIGKPLILPLIIVTISRFLIDETMTKPILIASLSVILFVTVCASAMSATYVRKIVMAKVISMWRPQQMC